MSGPLAGIRVLDLTSVVMGPYATQILGDYGADVIKVEAPGGDIMRQVGAMQHERMGHIYMAANRSKRSIVIDLKQAKGRDLLLQLAADADILLYNIRPQAMARLGLAYEDIAAVKPDIVYVGAFGFSQRGPYAARPAYDDLIQGMAGLPWLSQQAGAEEPRYVPMILADRVVGLQVVNAALAALHHRDATGCGQRVDVPMFEGLLSLVLGEHFGGLMFEPPLGGPGYQRSLAPNRKPYRTLNGYICTLIYTDKHWRNFFAAIGQAQIFETDTRFSSHGERHKNIDAVYGYLAGVLATRTTEDWMEIFAAADIPASKMNSIDDILGDEHLDAIGYFQKRNHPSEGEITELAVATEWSQSQPDSFRHAPRLGEHTCEILSEAGLDRPAIEALLKQGIVEAADAPLFAGDEKQVDAPRN